MKDSSWLVTNTRHDPHALGQHNSVFTISNGYLGLKGNLAEDHSGYQPVTLIHGIYDELDMFGQIRPSDLPRPYLDSARFDTAGRSPAVANLPDPLLVRIFIGDRELSFRTTDVAGFRQVLDLSCGLYGYAYEITDSEGRKTRLEMSRFASLLEPHLVCMRYQVTPLQHDARIRVHTGIRASTASNTTGEHQYEVVRLDATSGARCFAHVRTPARKHDVHLGVANVCVLPGRLRTTEQCVDRDTACTVYEFGGSGSEPITIDRFICLTSSEDQRHGCPGDPATILNEAQARGFDALQAEQQDSWKGVWDRADIEIDGDQRAQQYLRFCLYHLLAAAPRHTDRLSVPVKLLSGEYYQGNTFYDTDVYILPFFSLTMPEVARTCLNWGHSGLGHGREIARGLGSVGG